MRQLTYLSKIKYISNWIGPILTHCIESGVVSVLTSRGSEPLKFWEKNVSEGCIRRKTSENIEGLVIEISSPAFCKTYISLPQHPMQKIGTSLPVLTLVAEYLNMPFCFEIQVRDSRNMKRRFRFSTCKTHNKLDPIFCHISLNLNHGWNKIQVDMMSLTKFAYNTSYAELLGLQIYANCRLRWVYFSDRRYPETELPEEYRLKVPHCKYLPKKLGQDAP